MDFMGPVIAKQGPEIQDGAAMVTRMDEKPYAKIIKSKAYKLDAITREKMTMDGVEKSPAAKYLTFITNWARKVISGNVVPGHRENYLYLCGAHDEK